MDENNLLPVRIVQPSRDFLKKDPKQGGSGPKNFIENPIEYRAHQRKIISDITIIEKSLEKTFEVFPEIPSVFKAELISEAWAKSHRPNGLFELETCPIIGLDHMGELLISATKPGLRKLKDRIEIPKNQTQEANITTISRLKEFESKDKLRGLDIKTLEKYATRKGATVLKVILFDHQDSEINQKVANNFVDFINELGLKFDNISQFKKLSIWKIFGAKDNQINKICEHPSVRTVSFFPTFRVVVPKNLIGKEAEIVPPKPIDGQEYGKVGIIDGGISDSHPHLSNWVIDKAKSQNTITLYI